MGLPYTAEHEHFRSMARRFTDKEIAPYHAQWEKDGVVSRDLWRKAGAAGLLLTDIPAEYGGGGGDFLTNVVLTEEMLRGMYTGPGFRVHSDIVARYILHYGSEAQRQQWLPRMASGDVVGVVAAKLNALKVVRATGSIPENINFAIKTGALRDFLDNSVVPYQISDGKTELKTTDIARNARAFTLLISCKAKGKSETAKN